MSHVPTELLVSPTEAEELSKLAQEWWLRVADLWSRIQKCNPL